MFSKTFSWVKLSKKNVVTFNIFLPLRINIPKSPLLAIFGSCDFSKTDPPHDEDIWKDETFPLKKGASSPHFSGARLCG